MAEHNAEVLFERLRAMELPPGTYAVFGSGPLAIRGLIAEVGDLDIIVRDAVWDRLKDSGDIVMYGDDETVDLGNGLTFGRSWNWGDFDIGHLIDEAELIVDLPFVRPEAVAKYKRLALRPKDLRHLELMSDAGLIEASE